MGRNEKLPLVLCPVCSMPVNYGWWVEAERKVDFGDQVVTISEREYILFWGGSREERTCACEHQPSVKEFLAERIREVNTSS